MIIKVTAHHPVFPLKESDFEYDTLTRLARRVHPAPTGWKMLTQWAPWVESEILEEAYPFRTRTDA